MTQQIVAEGATVVFPTMAGDPATWQPTVEQVTQMQAADLVLLNGAGYEPWRAQVVLPESRMLVTADAFRDEWIPLEASTHKHGDEGEHAHGAYAFTTWIDFSQAKAQARVITDRLVDLLQERQTEIEGNWEILAERLDNWDAALVDVGEAYGGAPVLFSHPVYQYFERRYGFNGRSVHWEPDTIPGEDDWRDLEALLASHPAQLMIWEDEPLPEVVERLGALGVASAVFPPSANRAPSGDFGDRVAAGIEALRRAGPGGT